MPGPAAKILIDVAANVAALRKDMGNAAGAVEEFGNKIVDIGKKAAGAFLGFESIEGIKELVKSVGDLGEQADTIALSTDQFQAFAAAMQDAGVKGEQAMMLLGKSARFVGDALEGNKQQIDFFRQLGVGLLDAQGKARDMSEVISQTARAILAVEDPARRVALASQFMGKSGREAIPALQALSRGAQQLKSDFESSIIPPEVIERFDAFSDALDRAKSIAKARGAIAINDFITPGVVENLKSLAQTIGELGDKWRDIMGPGGAFASSFDLEKFIDATNKELQTFKGWLDDILPVVKQIGAAFAAIGPAIDVMVKTAKTKFAELFGSADDAAKAAQAEAASRANEETARINQMVGPPREPGAPPTTGTMQFGPPLPPGWQAPVNLPAVKGTGGVDKFAEAMKLLKEQIEATNAAMKAFTESSGLPTKEAERVAKMTQDIGLTMAKFKDLPVGQRDQLLPMVKQLEKAKFDFEELKQTQKTADDVQQKWGDGTKELTDTLFYLNKALTANAITTDEYKEAVKAANEAQALQVELAQSQKDGLQGLGAGWRYAALQAEKAGSMFEIGQEAFTGTFQTMSNAIAEFVRTGQLDFAKLAQSFAAMLAEMAAKAAASALINTILGAIGGGVSAKGPPTGGYTATIDPSTGIGYAIPRAMGGPIVPGIMYTVGERGPEKFISSVPGRIEPNGAGGGVVINNFAPGIDVNAERRDDGNLLVTINAVRRALTRDVARGGNDFASSLERTYRVNRANA